MELNRERQFPWEDVEAARQNANLQSKYDPKAAAKKYGALVHCPECLRRGDQLVWFYFESPDWTWRQSCGRAGWMAVCDDCHVQVEFFCTLMN